MLLDSSGWFAHHRMPVVAAVVSRVRSVKGLRARMMQRVRMMVRVRSAWLVTPAVLTAVSISPVVGGAA